MIQNIVFDVGKVLVYFEPDWLMDKLGYDADTKTKMKKAMFHSREWEEGDRGLCTKTELLNSFITNAPELEKQIRECYEKIEGCIELMPHVEEWIKDLKGRGYHLYLISNYGENLFEKTRHKMTFIPFMEGTMFSYQCKMVKPEHIIYEQLLKEYSLKASECVFIDDRQENVEAAREVGYKGVLFETYEQAKQELNALLQR